MRPMLGREVVKGKQDFFPAAADTAGYSATRAEAARR